MADQDAGWVDEDGLWWCVLGGAAAIRPEWFHTLVSVMSPSSSADRLLALLREGFTLTSTTSMRWWGSAPRMAPG